MEIDPFVQSFIDSTLDTMRRQVNKGEEIIPTVIMFGRGDDGGGAIMPLIGVNEFLYSLEGKKKLKVIVKHAWETFTNQHKTLQLLAVVVLSDAWVEWISIDEFGVLATKGRDIPYEPKNGQAESLVTSVSVAGKNILYQWPYIRREEGLVMFAKSPRISESDPGVPNPVLLDLWPL